MPDLAWNTSFWNGGYDWKTGGEEWSEVWGGSEAQWLGSLYPRLHRFLPARSIVEIAPGFGRWTKYLIPACSHYIGIDLSQECVVGCQRIFSDANRATFVKNDGFSLSAVQDSSCDFLFSFDSLVHAEIDVLQSYVPEILRVLTPRGAAFIHHSNLLPFNGTIGQPHARGQSVSADKVAQSIARHQGRVLIQEVINWGGEHTHDCLTLFARNTHPSHADSVLLQNPRFMDEAIGIGHFQSPYSRIDTGGPALWPSLPSATAGRPYFMNRLKPGPRMIDLLRRAKARASNIRLR